MLVETGKQNVINVPAPYNCDHKFRLVTLDPRPLTASIAILVQITFFVTRPVLSHWESVILSRDQNWSKPLVFSPKEGANFFIGGLCFGISP